MSVKAEAFCPAGVGNIGVGFDLLGHTFDGPGDRAVVRRVDRPGVRLLAIHGDAHGAQTLPMEPARNTAGRTLQSLLQATGASHGFEIELHKGIPLGSGLGGSAASAVAAGVAGNALLDSPLPREALYPHALAGEAVATDSVQGDNVGPMLVGGVALATPGRLLRLQAPEIWSAVVHPHFVLETRSARAVLTEPYPLADVVRHGTHLALFLTGLARGDLELVAAGLRDVLVEPRRAALVPGFAQVKVAALDHGALGASLSGAGPSVFGWFATREAATRALVAMRGAFAVAGLESEGWVGQVNGPRAELLSIE
ncbi:homoserine kinase [Lysobacter sp. GX 14042]|uniref:homoserine kinase n=1 Tax=Lysobacter sp. GX 14042 TaxID=2907155 RepID=UPI001F4298CD|nr:homoserine kinase [Lysobacter sp. GX 14042]MCE7033407.1 homoserine kinase [Lysobacter sp. GX 14042]